MIRYRATLYIDKEKIPSAFVSSPVREDALGQIIQYIYTMTDENTKSFRVELKTANVKEKENQ